MLARTMPRELTCETRADVWMRRYIAAVCPQHSHLARPARPSLPSTYLILHLSEAFSSAAPRSAGVALSDQTQPSSRLDLTTPISLDVSHNDRREMATLAASANSLSTGTSPALSCSNRKARACSEARSSAVS